MKYKTTKFITPQKLATLFKSVKINDFLDLSEICFLIKKSLWLVTVWDKNQIAGFGRLAGDGRLGIEISEVIVHPEYQNKGIGSRIMEMMMKEIKKYDPYFVMVSLIDEKSQHLYGKFGFKVEKNWVQMELDSKKFAKKISKVRNTKKACLKSEIASSLLRDSQ